MDGVERKGFISLCLLVFLSCGITVNARVLQEPEPLRIHVDAARSGGAAESGRAIEYGLRVALDALDNRIGGCPVELVIADHRGSSLRSKRNLERFLEDPRGLAVVSALHSPPLLAHREFINQQSILLLDPWAAAGPITRSAARPNWIFRLSVDDRVAGEAIVQVAVDQHQRRNVGLLLEQTGWGDSNLDTMTKALQKRNLQVASLQRFRWGMGRARAAEVIGNFLAAKVDSIYLVANTEEGALLVQAMSDLPPDRRIPIYSHWGITGGNFVELVGADTLAGVELHVLQSRFSFLSPSLSQYAKSRFARLTSLVPDIEDYKDLKAVPGFAHAHDLTLLLDEAAQGISCTAPILSVRQKVRNKLEHLESPVTGLVKTYKRPFSVPVFVGDNSHEALDINDLTLGRFGDSGEIYIHQAPQTNTLVVLP